MDPFATSHFSNDALRRDLKAWASKDCFTTAVLLTRIAEFDERKLFLEEGFPSMFAYCVRELHFTVGTAYKRINAARAARRFPAVLVAVAEGRLHLSAVVTLAGHLTSGNVDELVAAATHRTQDEVERLIADRFPRPDLPERLQGLAPPAGAVPTTPVQWPQLSVRKVDASSILSAHPVAGLAGQLPPGRVGLPGVWTGPEAPAPAGHPSARTPETPAPRPRIMPLAPQRFGFQATLDQETYDLLQQARALMSHQNPKGEIVPVLKSALRLLVEHLEKRKFAATTRPRPEAGRSETASGVDEPAHSRHIPAAVKRAVWERDGGRCTFVSDAGTRCPARSMLEFDHQDPVARGGMATLENTRLLCRAHNAHAAERIFGAEFMDHKRREARHARR